MKELWDLFYRSRVYLYVLFGLILFGVWKIQSFEIAVITGLGMLLGEQAYVDENNK